MSSSSSSAVPLRPKLQDQYEPKEDLWEQALKSLSDEDRKQYVDPSSSPREVLQKVRSEIQKSLDIVIRSSVAGMLRGMTPHGPKHIVSDHLSNAFTTTLLWNNHQLSKCIQI